MSFKIVPTIMKQLGQICRSGTIGLKTFFCRQVANSYFINCILDFHIGIEGRGGGTQRAKVMSSGICVSPPPPKGYNTDYSFDE